MARTTYSGETNSKSVNARLAEADDRYSASALGRLLGVPAGAIKAVLDPCEWHHTGSFAAETDYYDGALLIPQAANRLTETMRRASERACGHPDEAALLTAEACEQWRALRKWRAPKKHERRHRGCTIAWTEWEGSRRYPRRRDYRVENVEAVVKGEWIAFAGAAGRPVRKKMSGRWIDVTLGEEC